MGEMAATEPVKVSSGKACTVKAAGQPTLTLPISASLTWATICMALRLTSVMNALLPPLPLPDPLLVLLPAFDISPTSPLMLAISPETGAESVAPARLCCAVVTDDCAEDTCDDAELTWPCA